MQIFKKIVRKIMLWAFSDRIRRYSVTNFIDNRVIQMVENPSELKKMVLNKLSMDLAKKLVEEGTIKITESEDHLADRKEISFNIYCIL